MSKYKVRYINSASITKIDADSPTEAYKLFLEQTGAEPITVVVGGFLNSGYFDGHVEEAVKRIEEEKAQTGKHPQESADKENSNFDQPKIHAKLEDISATSTTEKLLLNIALTQEKQFQELKKLNYKLWSFWIFLLVCQY